MRRTPPTTGFSVVCRRIPAFAFAIVTELAGLDAAPGRDLVILGTLATGPAVAAGAGRPRPVVAVGAYA